VEIQSLRSKNEEFRMELQDKAEELESVRPLFSITQMNELTSRS
jgi:hypothetical protein